LPCRPEKGYGVSMPDVELERFKAQINLSEFAASKGYALDRRESSRNSAVMRHPDSDKIIIAQNENGDWMYFSIRDDRDNGTIIDFLQNRGGGSLGQVRKTLRAWLGGSRPAFNFPRSRRHCCRSLGIAPGSCRNGSGRGLVPPSLT
jgi:hypothetical protein